MKKILAITLTLLMAFTVAVFSASAADTNVAAIGEEKYESLAAAIVDADAGDTITLLSDVTGDVTINKNLTLDGAGKQYTGKISISGGKTVVIQNVNFVGGRVEANAKNTSNNLTVKGCNFEGTLSTYAIIINSGSNLIIEDCNAKDIGQGLAYAKNSVTNIELKNVNIDGAIYGLNMVNNTTTTFDNVTMKNVTRGLQFQTNGPKTITFNNCTISVVDNVNAAPVYISHKADTTQTLVFKGTNDFGTDDLTFGSNLVKTKTEVAQIGDEKYLSLKEAVENAKDGDVITIIKDHEIADSEAFFGTLYTNYYVFLEVNDKKVTIDLNGKVVTINPDLDKMLLAVFLSIGNGEITLKDSSEAMTGAINVIASDATSVYSMFTADEGGKFNIESGNYYINKLDINYTHPRSMIYTGDDKHFTVTGGNFILGNAHTDVASNGSKHPWIFNGHGQGETAIIVTGGTYNVDPTHCHGEAHFPDCYKPVEEAADKWTVKIVHTPGDAATCKAAQTCTVCGTELDAIKDHKFVEYVSDNNATCTADGTKTAKCIYDCGKTDTVTDEGSI